MKKSFLIVAIAVLLALVGCAEPEPQVKSYTVTVKHEGEVTLPDEVSVVAVGEKYTVKTYLIEGYEPTYSDGLKAGDEIEVSSDKVITIIWKSSPRTFFASGSGTEDDPYVIKNEHQFASIYHLSESMAVSKDNYLYFSVVNDLDFSKTNESPLIPVFRGEIDFNGHSVSGVDTGSLNARKTNVHKYLLVKYSGYPDAYGWIQIFISGKIMNLNMKISDSISIVTWGNSIKGDAVESDEKVIEFNNVTASSDDVVVLDGDTNFSGFISQCVNTRMFFNDCVNNVSYVGGSYGSAFLGGYGINSDLVFEGCVNNGSITAERVGFLVGNSANSKTSSITVKNCKNENLVQGTVEAGYLTWGGAGFKSKDVDSMYGEDKVKTLSAVSNVNVGTDSDGYFTVTSTNSDYASFKIQGSTYRHVYDGTTDVGTYLYSVSAVFESGAETKLARLQAIDIKAFGSEKPTVTKDEYGHEIVEKNGKKFFYNDSTPVKEGDVTGYSAVIGTESSDYIATLSYTLICYDAESNIVGSMKIK